MTVGGHVRGMVIVHGSMAQLQLDRSVTMHCLKTAMTVVHELCDAILGELGPQFIHVGWSSQEHIQELYFPVEDGAG